MSAKLRYLVIGWLLVGLAGRAGFKIPQDAEEYRGWALSSQRESTEYNGPYASRRTRTIQYKPNLRVSSMRAELQLQKKHLPRGGSAMQKEPADGKYVLVYGLYPVGCEKTRVERYGSSHYDVVHRATRGWMNGTSMVCPDPTSVS